MELKKEIAEKVKNYYLKGLNYNEIGKLLDINARTVQRYVKEGEYKKLKKPQSVQQQAIELYRQGLSYAAIAKKLKISKTTAYLWNKKARE